MQKGPGSPTQKGLTPPRSPSGEKYSGLGRTISPKQSSSLLEQFKVPNTQHNNLMPNEGRQNYNELFNPNFAKTEISSKNGSLDFGDLKSGMESTGGFESKPRLNSDKDSN